MMYAVIWCSRSQTKHCTLAPSRVWECRSVHPQRRWRLYQSLSNSYDHTMIHWSKCTKKSMMTGQRLVGSSRAFQSFFKFVVEDRLDLSTFCLIEILLLLMNNVVNCHSYTQTQPVLVGHFLGLSGLDGDLPQSFKETLGNCWME